MIKFEGVSKAYKNLILFENINTEITSKKTKIKGENGVGKSVFLKMMVGYSRPDAGKIYINDQELGIDCEFLQDAGISINAPQFIKGWTGLENLGYLRSIQKKCSVKELDVLIKMFGFESDIKKKYKTYSLGMQQKMRLIQSFMDKPTFLILDEPFDALDKKTKEVVKVYLDQYLVEHAKSMLIYTSHSEQDDDFADSILEIEDNNLINIF